MLTDRDDIPRSTLRHDSDAMLPAAAFLRYAGRVDGWSPGRQAAFLAHLADNGFVDQAAKSVGMSPAGGYSLRRRAQGYAFNLGWEAALIIARRIVADNVVASAIRGEVSQWVREDGVTTYTRPNSKLSMALLDRVNPATTLPEVMAVAERFDWYLELIDRGASAADMWEMFFDDALPPSDAKVRDRVRHALLLSEDSAIFEEIDRAEQANIETKSMAAPADHDLSQRCEDEEMAVQSCGDVEHADSIAAFTQRTQRPQRKRGSADKPSRPLRENPAPVMTSPCRGGASISPHLDVIAHRVGFAFDHFDAVFDEIADRDKTHGRIAINNRQMANASSGHQ
jgi:hypothetical protein